jgi:arginyl-tRNA synthetase
VIKALIIFFLNTRAVRESRLALCDLTARVLKQGLDVLGIETVEQM